MPFTKIDWDKHLEELKPKYIGIQIEDMKVADVIQYNDGKRSWAKLLLECQKCGRKRVVTIHDFFARGKYINSHSCCSRKMGTHRFRVIYYGMLFRCNDKRHPFYYNYGGRGIKVLWKEYMEFYNDMFESYMKLANLIGEENVSIDRIDPDKSYCKENCRWIPRSEQNGNTRNTVYFRAISPSGGMHYGKNLTQFCAYHGLDAGHLREVFVGKRHHHLHWTGKLLTRQEYEEYWKDQDCSEADQIIDIVHNIFQEEKLDFVKIPYGKVSNKYGNGYISPEIIDAVCSKPNQYGLSIAYNHKTKFFYVANEG